MSMTSPVPFDQTVFLGKLGKSFHFCTKALVAFDV
jgi:hypothetical protein